MTWYLVWVLAFGSYGSSNGIMERYIATTSETACNTARTGVKFGPTITSVAGTWATVSSVNPIGYYCINLPTGQAPLQTYPPPTP